MAGLGVKNLTPSLSPGGIPSTPHPSPALSKALEAEAFTSFSFLCHRLKPRPRRVQPLALSPAKFLNITLNPLCDILRKLRTSHKRGYVKKLGLCSYRSVPRSFSFTSTSMTAPRASSRSAAMLWIAGTGRYLCLRAF